MKKSVLMFILMYFIAFFICVFIVACKEQVVNVSYPLMGLYNQRATRGEFFLGCGTINSQEYYFGFIKTPNGILRLQTPVENCFLIETITEPRFTAKFSVSRVQCDVCFTSEHSLEIMRYSSVPRCLYIPRGTIITKYKVE